MKKDIENYCLQIFQLVVAYQYHHPEDVIDADNLTKIISINDINEIFDETYPDERAKKIVSVARRLRHKLGVNYAVAWLVIWATGSSAELYIGRNQWVTCPSKWTTTPGLLKYCKRVLNGKQCLSLYVSLGRVPRHYTPNKDVYLMLKLIQTEWNDCKDSIRECCRNSGECGSDYDLCCNQNMYDYIAEFNRYCNKYHINRCLKY